MTLMEKPLSRTSGIQDPKAAGYYFPAEFVPHRATWLSWPHKEASWPGKIDRVFPVYAQFVKLMAVGEMVCINVSNAGLKLAATRWLQQDGEHMVNIAFYLHPCDDA